MRMRWVRSLASDPHFTAFKMFLLPDWHNFLQSVDREAARLERLRTMRRGNRDRHRGLHNLHHAYPMRDCDAVDLPSPPRLIRELANLRKRHRLVSLVLQAQHLAADIILARGADKGADGARQGIGDRGFERRHIDAIANDANRAHPCGSIGTAADRRDERDLVAGARTIVVLDVFLVDRETDRVAMAFEGRELGLEPRPDLRDRRVIGKFARQLGSAGALAQRSEKSNRQAVHLGLAEGSAKPTRWPSSGRINFSMPRRHPPVEPGSAARNFPLSIPAMARLASAAEPISWYDSILNSSPKPGSSVPRSFFTTSAVTSRGATPVPPVTIIASRLPRFSLIAAAMVAASSRTIR